jgi:hypothetical protein
MTLATVIIAVVYVLALMRLTRLINADTILDRPRLAIITRARASRLDANEARALGQDVRAKLLERRAQRWATFNYFVQCPWCVGMWLALGTAWLPLWFADNHVVQFFGVALATSHLIGVCARFADTEEIDVVEDEDD